MLFSLRPYSVIAATLAAVAMLISISSPVLAAEGINNATPNILSLDGKSDGRKQLSSGKVLQVAQLAGDSWVVRQVTAPVRRDGADRAVAIGDRLTTGDRL
ncbi:MAG: hypothetical protein HQ502_06575, partial [Alphaproteobacteria bacterium]|nr:hypothetical protein [Alphaproteobacteria bacterium]